MCDPCDRLAVLFLSIWGADGVGGVRAFFGSRLVTRPSDHPCNQSDKGCD